MTIPLRNLLLIAVLAALSWVGLGLVAWTLI